MLVSKEIKDRVCYVKMQNGKHFNCLSEQMCNELMDSLKFGYENDCVGIVIAAEVNRGVWSAGHDIKEFCDMIVSSKNATFAITPAKIGIPYNASGIMHFINQLGMNKAREMFFLATPLSADDAFNVGLINRVAEPENLEKVLEEQFLAPLRRNNALSVSAIKRQFRILSRASTVISAENFERINAYRNVVYSGDDYKEGINSFLEKRPPQYKGKASDLD